jgi:CheY-like chemotaxis protein
VKDSGIGIPEDKLSVIFERFRQANDTYLSNEGGTGLGLSIAKALVELQGGRIWVDSKVGEGSCFYFTLPYKPVVTETTEIISNPKVLFNWNGNSVLIVEDDQFNASYLTEIIGATGVKYYHASLGKQAIEFVKKNPDIELVLMDIRLPDLSGLEVTQRIKLLKPEINIIAQTAYASDHDKFKAMEAGCNDYVSKPIDSQTLLNMIDRFFKSKV